MANTDFITGLTRGFHKLGFQIKKHSPEILVVAGVVGVVASAVLACKATTKVDEIKKEHEETVKKIHECAENKELAEQYTPEDMKKDLAITTAQTGLKYVKLYAPSVLLGAASLGCILTSHGIMRKRNVALSAAYAAIDTSFKGYRKRLVDRFGEELDKELKYNLKTKEVQETVVDENGKKKKVKKTVTVAENPIDKSPYSIVFECGNAGWDPDPEITKFFLVQQQRYANDRLQAQGYLFLNDVYDMLGAKRTKAGQVVGWVYDPDNSVGDNYVDFGIFNIYDEKACDFVNGREQNIILDFNVDGDIWSLMK